MKFNISNNNFYKSEPISNIQSSFNKILFFLLGAIVPLDFRVGGGDTGFLSISSGEIVIFCLLLLIVLSRKSDSEIGNNSIVNKYSLPLFGYGIWAFFSFLINVDREGFQVLRDVITVSVYYFIFTKIINSGYAITKVVFGYFFGVAINIAVSISQIAFNWPRPISMDVSAAELKEALDGSQNLSNVATGLFAHPNGLAPHISVLIILILGFVISCRKTKSYVVGGGGIAVAIFVLYFTFGKGAILWLSISLGTFFSRKFIPNYLRFIYSLALISSVLIVIVGFVVPYMVEEGLGGTVETRVILWRALTEVIDNNWIGALVGGNQKSMLNISGFYSSFEYPDAHNTYLNQIVYFGGVGFLLFIVFLFSSLRKITNIKNTTVEIDSLWISLVFILGYIYFEPMHQSVSQLGLICFLCACAVKSEHLIKYK